MIFHSRLFALPAIALLFLAGPSTASLSAKGLTTPLGFKEYFELEPFQIVGEEIPITVFARSDGDRRYATKFAHNVVEVVYETLEKSPGAGLVIIGRSGEPHPIHILERFLEKAQSPEASPDLKAIADELEQSLASWREKIRFDIDEEGDGQDEEFPVDMDTLMNAFPLPLPEIAADLYLLAWQENFDPERIDQRLQNLTSADLQQQEFQEFNWVFYLPPRNALNKVLKEVLPTVFKAEKVGVFKRVLIRGALAAFKPLIKDAMEGVRKGVLYWSVLSANESAFKEGDIEALASAYFESQMPRGRIIPGDKKERAIEAVKAQKLANEEYHKDPFVIPEPLAEFDPATYDKLHGSYGAKDHRSKKFFREGDSLFWQEGDDEPIEYLPAGENVFVSTKKDITLKFSRDDMGQYNTVRLRMGRMGWTFTRFPEAPLD